MKTDEEIRRVNKLINESWKDSYVLCIYGQDNIEIVIKALILYRESMQSSAE